MKNWKTLTKETVLSTNKFLTVEKHKVELHDGEIIPDWQYIITPDFANIVAVTKDNKFIIIKTYKYAVKEISLSPVGGYIELGEEPLACAKRELLEETGYIADEWIYLGDYVVDSNRGCGRAYSYLAKGAQKVSEPNDGDLEEQEILLLTRGELEKAISQNEFKVLPWIANILMALRKLDSD